MIKDIGILAQFVGMLSMSAHTHFDLKDLFRKFCYAIYNTTSLKSSFQVLQYYPCLKFRIFIERYLIL